MMERGLSMSYSIFRIQGIKTTEDLKGLFKHNVLRVSNTNDEIHKNKSQDNITLVECGSNYNNKFNEIVAPMKAEHEERMKTMRADRVKTFNQYVNSSKSDVAFESIFTSDKEFFEGMTKEDIKNWAEKSLEFLTKDLGIGKQNILHAVVHMDEKTPHLHVIAVPLIRKFNKKQNKDAWSISRRQFLNGKGQLMFAQDIYNQRMRENGYDLHRGEINSKKPHTTKLEYQRGLLSQTQEQVNISKQQLGEIRFEIDNAKEIIGQQKEKLHKIESDVYVAQGVKKDMAEDVEALESKLNALEEEYRTLNAIESDLIAINNIKTKRNITGSITLAKSDCETLFGLAKKCIHIGYKNKELERENSNLRKGFGDSNSERIKYSNESLKLSFELDKTKLDLEEAREQRQIFFKILESNGLGAEAKRRLNANKLFKQSTNQHEQ